MPDIEIQIDRAKEQIKGRYQTQFDTLKNRYEQQVNALRERMETDIQRAIEQIREKNPESTVVDVDVDFTESEEVTEAAAQIASFAKTAGKTVERVEEIFKKIKKAVVGQKLRSGKTIPSDEDKWSDEMWAYAVGGLKQALGIAEESQGAITTGSVGSPLDADGNPAAFGNSAIFAAKLGTPMKRKKKKSKKRKGVSEADKYLRALTQNEEE